MHQHHAADFIEPFVRRGDGKGDLDRLLWVGAPHCRQGCHEFIRPAGGARRIAEPPEACPLIWMTRTPKAAAATTTSAATAGYGQRGRERWPDRWRRVVDEAAAAAYLLELVSFQLAEHAIIFGTHGSDSISQV
jgi:hypothetical protein